MEAFAMERSAFELRITDFKSEAKDIVVLELQHPEKKPLSPFTAGSHLEVYLQNGCIRHYSLLNCPSETYRYVIAVGLAPNGRGGSQNIHQALRIGDLLKVSPPRNNFSLVDASEYCFIAGGIGITPILSMIRRCIAQGKKWRLFYSVRNKQRAGFYEELQQLSESNIHFHFNDEHEGCQLDISKVVASLSPEEHLYCCGPEALMQSVKDAAHHLPAQHVHFEWFSAPASVPAATDSGGFRVKLKRSGQEIPVMADQSILDALEQAGMDLPFSCRAGICRTCEVTVCSGMPDHLDMILSDEEKAANTSMLICVSRAKSAMIELDL